ncbi:microtubule-associated protein futsch isoform X3 [Salmo trutta]|uniref:microtubule-associated protein futsch isoform X3 n=1 Tax=Salmo trutta TaxID=8032 RepID=UPI001130BB4A|nr:shugoshin 2 isoform X3 [Salmo trutta]XP_029567300.1 shugoshin 2 isoform X3 [Salmo trutta]XP_029567301.1 shugoshin 2 isoform X3 [Salmo trutta]
MNMAAEGRTLLSTMLPVKKPMPSKAAKHNSLTVASKIKTKILNTSSFFKVSLKTNNKALALALVAQRERSRQLEVETVRLRKQLESLNFDLAIRRFKHNQLILILKDLQRNTLDNLERAVDLFSDENGREVGESHFEWESHHYHGNGSRPLKGQLKVFVSQDAPEVSEDHNKPPPDKTEKNGQMERVAVQIPLIIAEQSRDLVSPSKQTSTSQEVVVNDRRTTSTNPFGTQSRSSESNASKDIINKMEQQVDNTLKSTKKRTSRQSSSLKDEVEKWSKIYSDTGLDPIPAVLPSVVSTTNILQPSGTDKVVHHPNSLKMETTLALAIKTTVGEAEKTTINDTEMEITIGDSAAEIVTVETKPKKAGGPKKLKAPKTKIPSLLVKVGNKNSGPTRVVDNLEVKSSTVNVELPTAIQKVFSTTPLHTDNPTAEGVDVEHREEDFIENSASEIESLVARRKTYVTSRITKHKKPTRESHKTTQDFPKPSDPRTTFVVPLQSKSHRSLSPDPFEDDFFDDPEAQKSLSKLARANPLVIDDKVTKTKGHKTFVISNFVISNEPTSRKGQKKSKERRKTKAQPVMVDHELHIEAEKDRFLLPQSLIEEESHSPEACTAYVDMDATLHEYRESHSSSSASRPRSTTRSSKRPTRVKGRGTFVVSVNRDSSSMNSTILDDAWSEKLACTPTTGYDSVAEEEKEMVREESIEEHLTGPLPDHCLAAGRKTTDSVVEETHASSKRPWLATQEPARNSEGQESLCVEEEMPPWEISDPISVAAEKKPKKARRVETAKSRMKTDSQKGYCLDPVKERKKKTKSSSAKGLAPGGAGYILSSETLDSQSCIGVRTAAQNAEVQPVADPKVLQVIIHSATAEESCDTHERLSSLEVLSPDFKVSSFKPRSNHGPKPRCRATFVIPNSFIDSTRNRRNHIVPDSLSQDDGDTNTRTSNVSLSTVETNTEIPDSGEGVRQSLRELLMDERPPWESSVDVSCSNETGFDTPASSPKRVASSAHKVAVYKEPAEVMAERSPAERALKPLTNTNWTDNEDTGRARRRGAAVSYKLPPINCKMRRGDKFSDTKYLSSPIFKAKKKKKRRQQKNTHEPDSLENIHSVN